MQLSFLFELLIYLSSYVSQVQNSQLPTENLKLHMWVTQLK